MTKALPFVACALAALLLAGCGERTYTGILTAPGDEAARTFTLQGEEGTVYSVKVAENAPVAAWPEGTEPGDRYSGNWPALRLSVKGRASLFGEPVTLTAGSVQIDAAQQPEGESAEDIAREMEEYAQDSDDGKTEEELIQEELADRQDEEE